MLKMQYLRMTDALKVDPEIARGTQSSVSLPLPMLWNDVRTSEKRRVPCVRHFIASQGRAHGHFRRPASEYDLVGPACIKEPRHGGSGFVVQGARVARQGV